jgi:hypothetical protein
MAFNTFVLSIQMSTLDTVPAGIDAKVANSTCTLGYGTIPGNSFIHSLCFCEQIKTNFQTRQSVHFPCRQGGVAKLSRKGMDIGWPLYCSLVSQRHKLQVPGSADIGKCYSILSEDVPPAYLFENTPANRGQASGL